MQQPDLIQRTHQPKISIPPTITKHLAGIIMAFSISISQTFAGEKAPQCTAAQVQNIQKMISENAHTITDQALTSAIVYEESCGKKNAGSPKGALGVAQFMPATAKRVGVADRTNIPQSLKGANTYLKILSGIFKKKFKDLGDLPVSSRDIEKLVLAAYNAGEGTVLKAMNRARKNKPNTLPDYEQIEKYLPMETRDYVLSVLAMKKQFQTDSPKPL